MNKKSSKLLAAVAVFAMVACVFAVSAPVDADGEPTEVSDINDQQFAENGNYKIVTDQTLTGTVDLNGSTLTLGAILTINGGTISNGTIDSNDKNKHVTTKVNLSAGNVTGITFVNYNMAICAGNGGDAVISNCDFSDTTGTNNAAIYVDAVAGDAHTVEIKNNTYASEYNEGSVSGQIYDDSNTKIVVEGDEEISFYLHSSGGDDAQTITSGKNFDVSKANLKEFTLNTCGEQPASTLVITKDSPVKTKEFVATEGTPGATAPVTEPIQIKVESGATFEADAVSGATGYQSADALALSDSLLAVSGELAIEGKAYISGDALTIPEGKTLRIVDGGSIDMNNKVMNVFGTLIVEDGGVIKNGGTIYLTRTGDIQNEGIIGYVTPTTISVEITGQKYTGVGSVKVLGVTGIEFGFANTTAGEAEKPEYTLTVSGNIEAVDSDEPYSLALKEVQIVKDLVIADNVTVTNTDVTLMSKATITVDGTLDADGLTMSYNSKVVVNGDMVGTITAVTGVYSAPRTEPAANSTTTFSAAGANVEIMGYVLEVKSFEEINETDPKPVLYTYQCLYISGDLGYVYTGEDSDPTLTATLTVGGSNPLYIAEGVTVTVDEGMTFSNENAIVVLGTIVGDDNFITNYEGSSYKITTGTGNNKVVTMYVTTFENALAAIDTADKKTISVFGDENVETGFTLGENQIIDITGATEFTVDDHAAIILSPKATIKGTVFKVSGSITIMNGAKCSEPDNYDVKSEGVDATGVKFVKYSGIVAALTAAQPGEIINIVKAVNEKDLKIPAGVTVVSSENITLTGNLSIEEGAELIMESATLSLTGEKSKVDVKGKLDVSEETLTMDAGEDNSITSTGAIILKSANIDAIDKIFNGALYTNDDNLKVLTTVEDAVAAVAEKDTKKEVEVYGKVSAGAIDGEAITIMLGAEVTVQSITIPDGKTLTVTGELTGAVIVKTGVAGSEIDSKVDLKGASGIKIKADKEIDSMAVVTYVMDVTGILEGTMTVSQGTVGIGSDGLTVGCVAGCENECVITVAAGATLLVDKKSGTAETLSVGVSKNGAAALVVLGTLAVDKGTVNIGDETNGGKASVAGTMTVIGNGVTVESDGTLAVTGTLAVSTVEDEEGSLNMDGALLVGDKPSSLGAGAVVSGEVVIASGKYVTVYDGTTTDAKFVTTAGGDALEGASFVINDITYATVYVNEAVTNTVLNDEIKKLNDVVVGADGIEWYVDGEDVSGENIVNGTTYSTKLAYGTADIKTSVGTGISMSVDGVIVSSNTEVKLAIGEHTVSAVVQPGYKGDITITFNGQTVTNGKIVITSDMVGEEYVLSASGNIAIDTGSTGSSDGMSLTEILLIVLVVLIAIMAIVIAMRMMRS